MDRGGLKMKVGDLVTYKSVFKRGGRLKKRGLRRALGVVVSVQNCPISVTYPVWISWNFLNNKIRKQVSYELEVINESW
jgi:hypothetical protein